MAKCVQSWIAAAAGAGAAAACAAAGEAPNDAPAVPAGAGCDLVVAFGSYAMGIDRPAADAVDRILASAGGVKSVRREGAGREGEYLLCVETRSAAAAGRLFERLRAALPADPRGPITLRSGEKIYAVPKR